ncbi:Lar family restriction alleviation protein [Pseudomonas aeruginosa]|uniref:Lar family restriction alleviation protein n=1 Tax=Pseudomonas aeruginosa TaxID=287 RepID=UPI0016574636|nr:Lar family restriction alleviation protein [Pseudomonas aeruginosa]QNO24657.1 Lar family restriction alleviation protein [Pseudomonas aeruginosa]
MTNANECTCPSGDGSLAHPCPAHPASVKQTGGDERDLQAEGAQGELLPCPFCGGQAHLTYDDYVHDDLRPMPVVECNACHTWVRAESWNKRAALAQPSPAHAEQHWPKLEKPAQVGAIRFRAGLSSRLVVEAAQRLYEFESTPEKEAERIERLQAFREQCFEPLGAEFSKVLSENLVELSSEAKPEQAEAERPVLVGYRSIESGMVYEQDYGLKNPEALTTVAECERIVRALRAEIAEWQEAAGRSRSDVVAYIAERAKLLEERDAALARVAALESKLAELEKQEPVAWGAFHFGGERDGKLYTHCETEAQIDAYILDMHRSSDSLTLRKSPLYAAPFAQNQPTVPDGYALIPVRETEAMHDAVMALLYKGVARTDTQKLLDAYIAAAPGKEVPQAWLDVQAERRRQVEAEGWTPEHDDEHSHGQIARAAACYALAGSSAPNDGTAALLVSLAWPWDQQWWKPSTPRRDLVKACALALAEIERLDRACISQSPQPGATTASS